MTKKPSTNRSMYPLNVIVFLAFGIHFILLNDLFFTGLLFFAAIFNLIAFFQIPVKVSDQSIFINFFNGFLLFITAYNYRELNLVEMLIICSLFSAAYIIASVRQFYLRANYRRSKKRQKKFR